MANAARRPVDQPAPTVMFGHNGNASCSSRIKARLMTQLLTKDGGRRVRSVILDGFFGWYVESRGKNGWNFDAHCTSLDEVAKHIDLSTLTLD